MMETESFDVLMIEGFDDGNGNVHFTVSTFLVMEMDMSFVAVDCESVAVMFDVINASLCLWRESMKVMECDNGNEG